MTDIATRHAPRILWDGTGDNPYPGFFAHADAFVVTADSVNMTGECLRHGTPVFVFHPSGGKPKFHRFHAKLEELNATRRLPAPSSAYRRGAMRPIDATGLIAREIERRWIKRCAWLPPHHDRDVRSAPRRGVGRRN